MSAAAKLLDRLERVKQTGTGRWIASCPAHGDRSPSLSVREMDDGRVLLHDFGGCDTGDILAALGLQMSDLFEKPLNHQHGAASRSRIPARDLLELIGHEVDVAMILLTEAVERKTISEDDWQRLAAAARRIGYARDTARGN